MLLPADGGHELRAGCALAGLGPFLTPMDTPQLVAAEAVHLSPWVVVSATCCPAKSARFRAGGGHEKEHIPAGHLHGRVGTIGDEPVVSVETAGAQGSPGATQGVPVLAPPAPTAFREAWLWRRGRSSQCGAADHGLAAGLVVPTETGVKEAGGEVTALGHRQAGLGGVAALQVGHEGLLEAVGVVLLYLAQLTVCLWLQWRWRLVGGTPGV